MSRSIRMELPSLAKEGWLRPLTKKRRSLLSGRRRGGSFQPPVYRKLNEPPLLGKLGKEGSSIRMLRDISGSLCFHQPDCFACRGFTKVFSPLISLIRGRAAAGGRGSLSSHRY